MESSDFIAINSIVSFGNSSRNPKYVLRLVRQITLKRVNDANDTVFIIQYHINTLECIYISQRYYCPSRRFPAFYVRKETISPWHLC